jgi:hypothetical protein
MNLGGIGEDGCSEADRAVLLHVLGHLFGLVNEWDGEKTTLVSGIIDDDMFTTSQKEAVAQHAAAYAGKIGSNFPHMDENSIMR